MPLDTSNTLLRDPNKKAATSVLQQNVASANPAVNTAPRTMMANAPAPSQSPVQKAVSNLATLAPNTSSWMTGAESAVGNIQRMAPNAGFGSVPQGGPAGTRLTPATAGAGGTPAAVDTPAAPPPTLDQQQKDILGAGYQDKVDIDTTKSDKFTQDQIDTYKGTQDWTKNAALNAMSNSMRAAGAASQHGGLAPGSSSYLSNWRQATATGQRNLNDIMTGWQKGYSDILGGAAAGARGVETTQAGLDTGVNANNASGVRDLQGEQRAAETDKATNQNIGSVDQIDKDFTYLFNEHNLKSGQGKFNSLFTTYKNSLTTGTPEEQAAAYQAIMDYVTPITAARDQWLRSGGKDKNGDFEEWYHSHY